MNLTEKSAAGFSRALASRDAVPGGGGAGALAGALGIALGHMVGELTVGKRKYAAVEMDVRALMERAETLREALLGCVEEDAAAFAPLSRAYAIPRDAPGRDEEMERCLRAAAAVPLKIFALCGESLELLREFAQKGSALAISDAATGASLCRGALEGAAMNVRVNTSAMKDRACAAQLDAQLQGALDRYRRLADEIFAGVWERLSR